MFAAKGTAIFLNFFTTFILINAADSPPPGGYYTTRYDHLDVEDILNQKRLVYFYAECMLDRGPCTPQGIEFKRILPEALRTNCMRCTEKQRFVTMKSIRRLKKEYPDVWAKLSAAWDPTGMYVKQLEDSVNKKFNRSPEAPPSISDNKISEEVPKIEIRAPTPSPTTIANVIAEKPISFSTVNTSPIITTSNTVSSISSTTARSTDSINKDTLPTTSGSISSGINVNAAATNTSTLPISNNPTTNALTSSTNNIPSVTNNSPSPNLIISDSNTFSPNTNTVRSPSTRFSTLAYLPTTSTETPEATKKRFRNRFQQTTKPNYYSYDFSVTTNVQSPRPNLIQNVLSNVNRLATTVYTVGTNVAGKVISMFG